MLIGYEARDTGLFWKILSGSFVIIAVVFSFPGAFAFNLDLSSHVTYNGPPNSFFGFSVAGYIDNSNKSLVLIGAPQDTDTLEGPDYKGGSVYICDADAPNNCQKAKFSDKPKFPNQNLTQQWLGATLTSSGSRGIVVVCAPRYWIKNNEYSSPTGFCYYTPNKGQLNFSEFYNPCIPTTIKDTSHVGLGFGQAGFSAAIAKDSGRFYVGAVGAYSWKGMVFARDAKPLPSANNSVKEMPKFQDSYMGYSMTSLNFLDKGKSGIALGIPRALNVSGQVAIFTPTIERVKTLSGQKHPDYFGHSMCSSDVDGDGADDLIIGAPMYAHTKNDKDYEIGRIYVFYQGKLNCTKTDSNCTEKMFARNETIDGVESGARFGSALASLGDINKDGYEDIAVSAPYEGSNKYNTCASATRTTGAVYIYLGSENGLSKTPSQVIKASDVAHLRNTSQLSAFGHSLSGGLDLDKNQYPDLIVGAYESDAVFLFKSRPVINLTASLSFLVKKTKRGNVPLDRNTCTSETKNKKYACVTLKICMQYSGVGVEDQIDISTNITLDTKYADTSRMRFSKTKNSTLKLPLQLTKNKKKCENETVYVDNKDPDIEKVTPLEASLQYELVESKNKKTLSSILNFGPTTRTDSFNISRNCGDDDICYPNLNLTVIPNIKQYDPLSNIEYLYLQVLVKNNGEDSYESRLTLQVPKGLEYYNHADAPQTDKFANLIKLDGENITFSIGNPLQENQKANFSVISRINKTLEDLSSAFHFWAKVNSTDPEKKETLKDNIFLLDIPIREIVNLEISSASYITVRKDIEAGPEVIHQYIIKNSGTANLSEVSAIFFWPVKLTNGGDLLYLMEQPKTQGSIQCDYVANVNYKNLTKIRAYKNTLVIPWVKNSNDAKPRRSTNQTTSEDTSTSKNPVSNNSTDYQKIRCTIRNLSREEEVSVLFPSVVWMETIEQIAGFRNKSLEIGSWVEVNVTTLSRNVTQIPEKPYRNEAITTIEFEKAYIEEAIPAIIKSREPDVIPLWSVVRSCVLGVLILMSMICGLYKLGFFKRNRPPTFSAAEEACQESDLIVKMGKSSCDEMDVENAQATKEMERRVNQMCMETITLRQCIKKIVIENEIELDENTLNMLKLPNVTIEYRPISNTGILIDTSPDTEYLVPIDHKWEFPRSNLSFGKCLGVGEFGKVVAAEAFGILHQNVTSAVAVKSLKNGHSDADMIDLVYEMEIMKLIGSHVNILQLLGCCTQGGELLIITEFAQHGNLRDFLRNYVPSSEDKLIHNNLTRKTLLLFAQQLAKGMEYLASKRCIHRDLAARNVLVSDNYIMKIADFGLARDIQNKEYYRKKTKGRLPVKWMAPEALSHGRYTTQSDVWSYGIVLWEILTLGATPYPSLQNVDKLFFTLRSGYRLEKPPNCSVETYSLIQKCWSLLPEDRPTFTMIIDDLDNILSDIDDQTPKLSSFYQPDDEQCNPNDEENSIDSESE